MRGTFFAVEILLAVALTPQPGSQRHAEAPQGSNLPAPSVYRVSFERRDPVPGVIASAAIRLPFECTSDGTMFVSFVDTPSVGTGAIPAPGLPHLRLVSVSLSGTGHSFDLNRVPDLYISREVDHFASESEVVFLVEAAREYKPEKKTFRTTDGTRHEYPGNAVDQQRFVISFDRDGVYQRTVRPDVPFRLQQVGVFQTGALLALGYDEKDHSPRLAMLKDDGTLLKPLHPAAGDMPESLLGNGDGKYRGVIRPVQLVPESRSILILQSDSHFPLLEVNEGGGIRAIRPKWPKDFQIEALIPSNLDPYAVAGAKAADPSEDSIYELRPDDGAVLRRFDLSDGHSAQDVACVHDEEFLSLDYGDGKIVPLIGSPEPAPTEGSPIAK
jgi:hypothetical protein